MTTKLRTATPSSAGSYSEERVSIWHLVTTLQWCIPVVALLLSNDLSHSHSYLLYAAQLGLIFACWNRIGALEVFLSPISLVILYVDVCFVLGSWAFSRELVMHMNDHARFIDWHHMQLSNFFVLAMIALLFHVDMFLRDRFSKSAKDKIAPIPRPIQKWIWIISIVSFCFFLAFPLRLGALGGAGNFSAIPMSVAALMFFLLLAQRQSSWRFVAYGVVILLFAATNFGDKRVAIFFIFPIMLLEAVLFKRKLGFGVYLMGLILCVIFSVLIIMMSILRGYGSLGQGTEGFLGVLPLVADYVMLDGFLTYFFNNIEVNYTYYHSMQALEYVFSNPKLLSYGSTVFKFLTIPLPSDIFVWKPMSFIDSYTKFHDPAFRALGGSWPPNVVAEMAWNFHLAGLLVFPTIMAGISMVYYRMVSLIRSGQIIKHSWLLYAYMNVLTYARGAGLDIFFVYVAIAMFFSYLFYFGYQSVWGLSRGVYHPAKETAR